MTVKLVDHLGGDAAVVQACERESQAEDDLTTAYEYPGTAISAAANMVGKPPTSTPSVGTGDGECSPSRPQRPLRVLRQTLGL